MIGRIELVTRAVDGVVLLEVRDTGVGVPPEQLDYICEPFRQAVGRRRRQASGTGLELSVTRSLARLLGGDVTVESTVGEGSTFVAQLPVGFLETDARVETA